MNHSRTLTVAAVVALVGMLAFPMAATAAADLSVGVEQGPDTGEATVTVADNETAVENATVTVTSESGYAGNGTYETDANGSVALPEPNETVSVTVTVTQYDEPAENASVEVDADSGIAGNYTTDENGTVTLDQPEDDVNGAIVATDGNLTAETGIELSGAELAVTAEQRDDGVFVTVTDGDEAVENATVEVESDGDYSGTGTYATDADGEVALALPTENVTIDVTATDGNETTRTSADLTVDIDSEEPFGLTVSNFVSALQNATVDGPPGQVISEFVTGNNPGSAGDVPGQSGEAPGQSDEAAGESGDAPGQSGDAPGQSGDAPGQSGDDADDENETADDDTEVSESDEQGAAGGG